MGFNWTFKLYTRVVCKGLRYVPCLILIQKSLSWHLTPDFISGFTRTSPSKHSHASITALTSLRIVSNRRGIPLYWCDNASIQKKFLLQHKIIWKQKKRILKSTEIYAKSCKHSSEIYAEFKNQRIILTKKIMKWHENHGNSNNIHISYKNW